METRIPAKAAMRSEDSGRAKFRNDLNNPHKSKSDAIDPQQYAQPGKLTAGQETQNTQLRQEEIPICLIRADEKTQGMSEKISAGRAIDKDRVPGRQYSERPVVTGPADHLTV